MDTLVIDKTGTLTEGKPTVTAVVPAHGMTETEALRLAASSERPSEHPLAVAIVRAAEERAIQSAPVADFDSPTGKGAMGIVESRPVLLGNRQFLCTGQSPLRRVTSAAASAGASLTPLPAMATTSPAALCFCTTALFCSGSTSASTSSMPSWRTTLRVHL